MNHTIKKYAAAVTIATTWAFLPAVTIAPTVLMTSCASIQVGQDKTLVNAQRTIKAGHETVYALERLESEQYYFFKAHAPEQAVVVRRQVNVLRKNFPQIEQDAWNAVEAYRKEASQVNKSKLDIALVVLAQIVSDAQHYITQLKSIK